MFDGRGFGHRNSTTKIDALVSLKSTAFDSAIGPFEK